LNLDRHLAACGITSFFHALSFTDNELGLRSPGTAADCVRKINNLETGLAAVTSGPGRYINPETGPGQLFPGAPADILIVNQDHAWAHITRAFINGRQVFSIEAPSMSRAV
jgi:alpha-D-ribose 1-methylphosphonate 5-triphosphate diphosphatase PhnM